MGRPRCILVGGSADANRDRSDHRGEQRRCLDALPAGTRRMGRVGPGRRGVSGEAGPDELSERQCAVDVHAFPWVTTFQAWSSEQGSVRSRLACGSPDGRGFKQEGG
jgi:hypothetical protein